MFQVFLNTCPYFVIRYRDTYRQHRLKGFASNSYVSVIIGVLRYVYYYAVFTLVNIE